MSIDHLSTRPGDPLPEFLEIAKTLYIEGISDPKDKASVLVEIFGETTVTDDEMPKERRQLLWQLEEEGLVRRIVTEVEHEGNRRKALEWELRINP